MTQRDSVPDAARMSFKAHHLLQVTHKKGCFNALQPMLHLGHIEFK